ncbi:WD REPEATS REGION domain-containing protein [Citrus sinensis]|uniref:WD REPEATS REGION domain-containing protein n=1 Tax=Citrus sinensis TaxID=2711 RepID=A0ACB8P228_CITSI|nr:WD REPEATS REGION domain-containing protein [Citrus sinensis]
MSHHHADDAEYMADEYDMEDIDDDMDEEFRGRDMGGSDSDVDEYDYSNNKIADTSAAQARRGKDIQGIPWERLSITREKYRQTRLEQYKNYENIPNSGEGSGKDCKVTKKGASYYEFRRNSRSVKSTILHFQLRNLVWATSKHDVYLMSHFSVIHWSSLTSSRSQVLNVSGHVAPSEKHPGSLLEGFTQTQVSTLAVKDKLLVAGGFQGELICKHLDRPGVSFCSRTTYDDNAITNAVEIYGSPSGAVHFTASNNDCGVRDFDMGKYQLSKHFRFPWPVNTTASLCGHLDFSFASAWHPDGVTFATGNQDKTCRIWDLRNLSESVAVLKGNLGAIRSIRYTSDGRYMATAEPADFVHVYDVKSGYEKEQEIDFFGEISGISFSPDTESLFIGVWDRTYGSLLEYVEKPSFMPVGESRCKCAATCNLGYCGSINCDSTSCGGGRQKMCENAGIDVQRLEETSYFM